MKMGQCEQGIFQFVKKNCRSSEVSPEFWGPYYRSDDVFEKSLVEFLQEYLKESILLMSLSNI